MTWDDTGTPTLELNDSNLKLNETGGTANGISIDGSSGYINTTNGANANLSGGYLIIPNGAGTPATPCVSNTIFFDNTPGSEQLLGCNAAGNAWVTL